MTRTATLRLEGIKGRIEILIDKWGVPHLYAENTADLFFGQGYQAAQMRLWQMDIWRRRGLGRVAEVLGDQYLAQDRIARLLLFRGDLVQESRQYGEEGDVIVSGFVAGVNAFVEAVNGGKVEMPVEFQALGYKPSLWTAEDIYRIRAGGRHDNAREEIIRGVTLRRYGPQAERLRKPLSNDWVTKVPQGLDLTDIDEDLLVDFNQFMNFMSSSDPHLPDGSNHWAVAGFKTSTGRPILANDPHREMAVPSLRYLCHLNAPGIDVVGAAEPYRPGVTIGHNRDVAFGLTIFPCDQEDIYVYETNEDGTHYRYRGKWVEFQVQDDEFAVSGRVPVTERLMFSQHGPIVAVRPERRRAYGLRAAWLEPGGVPYFQASMRCMFARSVDDVRAVAAASVSPGINLIFADTTGNIGLRPAGIVPKRPNWDGLLPVPGDGRYEWDGFLSVSELLDVVNPVEGWVGNGNQFNVPVAAEAGLPICLEAEPNHRYQRIKQMLSGAARHDVEDSLRLQLDAVSLPAIRLATVLEGLTFRDAEAEATRQLLVKWDGVVDKGSDAAALFELWWRKFMIPAMMAQHLAVHGVVDPEGAVQHILSNTDSSKTPEQWLEMVEAESDSIKLVKLMETTLLAACRARRDDRVFQWGDLHKLSLRHPLTKCLAVATGFNEDAFCGGPPVPVDGDGDTINNTGFKLDWSQRLGASVRLVYDIGDWDRSVAMIVPGQSGVPDSEHFRDLTENWHQRKAFPLLYSRSRIEEMASERLLLVAESE